MNKADRKKEEKKKKKDFDDKYGSMKGFAYKKVS